MRAVTVLLCLLAASTAAADDCWTRTYEGGSGFGGDVLRYRPDCRGPALVLDTYASFGEFLAAPVLPRGAATRPGLIAKMVAVLYGSGALRCPLGGTPTDARCTPIDASFAWLIEAYRAPAAPLHTYTPIWTRGAPVVPPTQVVVLDAPADRTLATRLAVDTPPALAPRGPFALLAYHAHNHGALRASSACAAWQVFTTAHGVAVLDRATGLSSWVYVSTGLEKLRHPSIGATACLGDLVFAAHTGPGSDRHLVVIDPRRGRVATLPAR